MKIASKELSAVSLVKAAFEKARQFAKYNIFVSLADEEKALKKAEEIDKKNTFLYLDPPYLLGRASYNENNLWTENNEKDLLKFLERCNKKEIKFALSNVIEHKGNENRILKNWCSKNNFFVNYLDFNYYNSNYQVKKKNTITREVLITNFTR